MSVRNSHLIALLLFAMILSSFSSYAQDAKRVRVACVGNSITYGATIEKRFQNCYPTILQQFMGEGYDVRNFGVSGSVVLQKGDYPYKNTSAFREALDFNPDIVVIKLGTNDSKPHNWQYGKDFEKDYADIVHAFAQLPAQPKIYLCLPVPAKQYPSDISDSTIRKGVIPVIRKVAKKEHLPLIDLYKGMEPYYPAQFTDFCHPSAEGASTMAGLIYNALTGKETPQAHHPAQPFPGQVSTWHDCARYDFVLYGRHATVVVPKKAAKGNPWIWRPAFFDAFPPVDVALLEKGFHIAYYDLTHLYGSPRSVELGHKFHEAMHHEWGLSDKVVVEGLSRGGYFAFQWAKKYPELTACLYVDAPVCDVTSWPGKKEKDLWNGFLNEWGIQDAQPEDGFEGNALNAVKAIAENHIPIMAVCGGADKVVPYKDNFFKVRNALMERGGIVEEIVKPDCDHHPHSLENPEPIVDFILRYQNGYTDTQKIMPRTLPTNAVLRFIKEKKGCVAFLGGSITEMNGWRNMMKEDLQQRFPDTEFTFIEAGIASTGSTPHAFRLEHDVLEKGTPDLLFVEAAVNDDTNYFTAEEQIKGMEGIVRHLLNVNSMMDIVMLHFIYDPFLPLINEKGQTPEVILNHERVADYYRLSSIDLAQEVATRIKQGELTWQEFGGTHPAPRGHKIYTASINYLLDMACMQSPQTKRKEHAIPEEPLDKFCYSKGCFIDLSSATKLKGFHLQAPWTPRETTGIETRPGFVNVPMLVGEKGGSSFRLEFEGRAVGIFCVAGPKACTLEYRTDKGPWKTLDTKTEWSSYLYIPWVYMFEKELPKGKHTLQVRIAKGESTECQIRNFVVNR